MLFFLQLFSVCSMQNVKAELKLLGFGYFNTQQARQTLICFF